MNGFIKGLIQISFFILFSLIGNFLVQVTHLKIPGSIVGLLLLFVLLQLRIIKLKWIDIGASWLLSEMILFFIPAAVGIIQYKGLIAQDGIRILLVITLSTLVVMAFTGLLTELLYRKRFKSIQRSMQDVTQYKKEGVS